MPATVRYDDQYCPIARAMDVLGDRWTLLILRELIVGDQRFTDLREHLPGIAPTMLTQRLRTLTQQGLVSVKELPPPAARSVYTITEQGRSVTPVLRALTRWGMPLLEEPDENVVIRPWTIANAVICSFYDPDRADGIDERYLVRIDGDEFPMSSVGGGGEPRPSASDVDLTLTGTARVWIDIRQGRTTLRHAIRDVRIERSSSKAALDHFASIFQFR